ncbi:DUF4303 domain-containing protein [Salana multivorans]
MNGETERVVVMLRERPPAAVVMRLHRLLGLGAADVARRTSGGAPLLDRGLFLNDHLVLIALLRDVLAELRPLPHEVHVLGPGEEPSPGTVVAEQTLWAILAAHAAPSAPVRPVPDAALAHIVAGATRAALTELAPSVRERLCAVALVTSGEALRPYLTVTAHGEDRWDLAGSEHALTGDEHLAAIGEVWDARGYLSEMGPAEAEAEYVTRLATLEEALRLLDVDGELGRDEARGRVLLLVATMPPDETDAGYARRLNPPGPLLDDWLDEAGECATLRPQPEPEPQPDGGPADQGRHTVEPPTPALAELWRITPGLLLDDGTRIYRPDEIAERNETFQVAEYSPGWALVGDDSGGSGYLVRRVGPAFDPVTGRVGAEVYRLGLGALTEDVPSLGEFVTDDLIGWLAARQS